MEKRPVVMHPRKFKIHLFYMWGNVLMTLAQIEKTNVFYIHSLLDIPFYVIHDYYIHPLTADGMAFRNNYMSWLGKSQNETTEILESFANTCRNRKVIWNNLYKHFRLLILLHMYSNNSYRSFERAIHKSAINSLQIDYSKYFSIVEFLKNL